MPLFDPSPYKLPAPPQEEEEDDDPLSLTIKAAEEEADRQQASRSSGDTYQYQGQNPNWMADAADEEAGRRAATATPQKSPEKPPAPVQIQKPEERKTTARDGQCRGCLLRVARSGCRSSRGRRRLRTVTFPTVQL